MYFPESPDESTPVIAASLRIGIGEMKSIIECESSDADAHGLLQDWSTDGDAVCRKASE